MKVAFFILALLGLTACGTKPQVTTSAATPPMIATRLLAEMVGELTIENECLRINDYLLVWPPDFTVDIKEDMVEIRDEITGEKIVWRSLEAARYRMLVWTSKYANAPPHTA